MVKVINPGETGGTDSRVDSLITDFDSLDASVELGRITPSALPSPLPAADKGQYYLFTAPGTITVDSVEYNVQKSDRLRCEVDDTPEDTDANWAVVKVRSPSQQDLKYLKVPNAELMIWQWDHSFSIPASANEVRFNIADYWAIVRSGNTIINQTITVERRTDAPFGQGYYLHLAKPAEASGTTQVLELVNSWIGDLDLTSDRTVIVSYQAKSATGCNLGVRIKQKPVADSSPAESSFVGANSVVGASWETRTATFDLADLSAIANLKDSSKLELAFFCNQAQEAIDLDIGDIQIDFADQSSDPQPMRRRTYEDYLTEARLFMQKSGDDDQKLARWADEIRYDNNGVNSANNPLNPIASTTEGHTLKETVSFNSPVIEAPATGTVNDWDYLYIFDPTKALQRAGSNKFFFAGSTSDPAPNIDIATRTGFTVSARTEAVTANEQYECHWVYSYYPEDRRANGGGY